MLLSESTDENVSACDLADDLDVEPTSDLVCTPLIRTASITESTNRSLFRMFAFLVSDIRHGILL